MIYVSARNRCHAGNHSCQCFPSIICYICRREKHGHTVVARWASSFPVRYGNQSERNKTGPVVRQRSVTIDDENQRLSLNVKQPCSYSRLTFNVQPSRDTSSYCCSSGNDVGLKTRKESGTKNHKPTVNRSIM